MSKGDDLRVGRGGGWDCPPAVASVALRDWDEPWDRNPYLGFRLARVFSPFERLSGAGKEVSRGKG